MATVAPSLISQVSAAIKVNTPKGFSGGTTGNVECDYFHGMLYGETDSCKTVTAALFGGPARTFILCTRSEEQLRPIKNDNFHYAKIEDGQALAWALQFPEKAADAVGFPEWKDLADRVLLIDDMTEGANMFVDDNSTRDDGSEVKDGRQIYKAVNGDMRAIMTGLKRRKMHLIMTALAKVAPSNIANEETIYPELPTGLRSIITADLEYCFFMRKSSKKMLTTSDFLTFVKKDEKTGKPVPGRREIFGKNKLPRELVGKVPPVLLKEEPMDLAAVWQKILGAKK